MLCDETRRRALFEKDGYEIVRCQGCGLVYVDADLGSADLQQRYGADYYGGGVFDDYIAERDERIAGARAYCRLLNRLVPAGRLLDVGCATGFFLEAASQSWGVTGVELSDFAAEYARHEFGHTVLTGDIADVGLPDASFDVVTLWNTVEHMADPRRAISHVARVAAPNALVVLTTGNVAGPLARRDLVNWNLMTPPEHLYFFDPSTITRLLEDAGLTVRRIAQDGLVTTNGSLSSTPTKVVAAALGLGNVMTVYARRMPETHQRVAVRRRLGARVRPVARV
jgi:SAM-dependent methyltransferase